MRDATTIQPIVGLGSSPGAPAAGTTTTPLDLTGYVDLDSGDRIQLFLPALTVDGAPRLQPGEAVLAAFDTIGAGIRSGSSPIRHVGGSMEEMAGRCFVTTTRLVFVCHRWSLGGDLRSAREFLGLETDARGEPSAAPECPLGLGPRLLVGQVRWPWLAGMSHSSPLPSSPPGRGDGLIEVRCVQDGTSRYLSLVPAPSVDVGAIIGVIVRAVHDDRLGRRRLGVVRVVADDVPAPVTRWTTFGLPGAFPRTTTTAMCGRRSAASLAPWRYYLTDPLAG